MKRTLSSTLLILALSPAAPASADTAITLFGAMGFGSGAAHSGFEKSSFGFGGELVESFEGIIDLGLFYHMNPVNLSGGGSGTVHFGGAVLRGRFGKSFPLFIDAQLGTAKFSSGDVGSSEFDFGAGFGLGYTFPVGSSMGLSPRLGFRSLAHTNGTVSTKRQFFDIGLGFTYTLGGGGGGGGYTVP